MLGDADRLAIEREAPFVERLREERAVARKHDEGGLAVLSGNEGGAKPSRDERAFARRQRRARRRSAVRRDELAEVDPDIAGFVREMWR